MRKKRILILSAERKTFDRYLCGGDSRGRTGDLLNAIQALYQLSYTPEASKHRSLSALRYIRIWWRRRDSNPGPLACEASALTD